MNGINGKCSRYGSTMLAKSLKCNATSRTTRETSFWESDRNLIGGEAHMELKCERCTFTISYDECTTLMSMWHASTAFASTLVYLELSNWWRRVLIWHQHTEIIYIPFRSSFLRSAVRWRGQLNIIYFIMPLFGESCTSKKDLRRTDSCIDFRSSSSTIKKQRDWTAPVMECA